MPDGDDVTEVSETVSDDQPERPLAIGILPKRAECRREAHQDGPGEEMGNGAPRIDSTRRDRDR